MKQILQHLIKACIFFGLSSIGLPAQMTTVTATVVDSDGTTWANGTWNIKFVPNSANPAISIYNQNGTSLSNSVLYQNGTISGAGALSITVYDSSTITPIGSAWSLTVCPNASTLCGIYKFSTAGASMNISSNLTAIIPAPRFVAGIGSYGYNDTEAQIQLKIGSTYWNVTTGCQRTWSGSSWQCPGVTDNEISIIAPYARGSSLPLTCTTMIAAKCDGNTDDTAAIQSTLDCIYDSGFAYSALVPAGTCYLASSLNYRGESIHGVSAAQSIIEGNDGLDVFQAPDLADSPVRACCAANTHVHDLTIKVSNAVDPTTTSSWAAKGRGAGQTSIFANRIASWTGQTIVGTVLATDTSIGLASTTNLASYMAAVNNTTDTCISAPNTEQSNMAIIRFGEGCGFHAGYSPFGWVQIDSEYMSYQGISSSGCPNSAPYCLLHVHRGMTLAGIASSATTHSNGTAIMPINPMSPTDVTDWLPAWTIGNCAFAFPGRDANHISTSVFDGGFVDHVIINFYRGIVSGKFNNSCGFYFQNLPTNFKFDHNYINVNGTYAVVEGVPAINQDVILTGFGISSDVNQWSNSFFNSVHPFIVYVGANNLDANNWHEWGSSNDVDGPTAQAVGPSILGYTCHSTCTLEPGDWTFLDDYGEQANLGGAFSYPPVQQLSGLFMKQTGGTIFSSNNQGYPVVIDTDNSEFNPGGIGINYPNWVIYGGNNKITVSQSSQGLGTVIDKGFSNRISVIVASYANTTPLADLSNKITPEFLTEGTSGTGMYQSRADLFFPPDKLYNFIKPLNSSVVPGSIVPDLTAPITHKYIVLPANPSGISQGLFGQGGSGVVDVPLVVGQNFPATKGIVYLMLKTPSGSTEMDIQLSWTDGSNTRFLCNPITTTWTTCSAKYDATGKAAGSGLSLTSYAWSGWISSTCIPSTYFFCTNPPQEVDVAYIGFAPYIQQVEAMNVDSINGYTINGTLLATGNLADWTNTGVANGSVPTWNTGTSKWTPGVLTSAPCATAFQLGERGGGGTYTSVPNNTVIWAFDPVGGNACTFSKISYVVGTPDNTAVTYDWGVYNSAGTLLCDTGAIAGTVGMPSATIITLSFSSSCTITPNNAGHYYLAWTANTGAVGTIDITSNVWMGKTGFPSSGGTTTGGALNATIIPGSDSWGATNGIPFVALHN